MKILVLFYLLIFNNIFAQKITVLEQGSNVAVPYATVVFYKDDMIFFGDYTNDFGEINFQKEYDFINISCLGFETRKVFKNQIENNVIFLNKINIQLEEVVLTNNKQEFIAIGENKRKKSFSGSFAFEKGSEVVQFIENKLKKTTKINSFAFVTEKVKNKVAYRVHLYKRIQNFNATVDIEIPTLNTIYYLEKDSNGLVEINLSQYDIDFPLEGIYIGLESLGTIDNNGQYQEYTSIKQWVQIQYQYSKNARTHQRHLFLKGTWFDVFQRDKTNGIKFGHGDLKVIFEPYFILKVAK